MEPTFEGGAPATAGPAPESPKAGAKPKSNNAKRMKKKRQDVKGEAADIVSAEDVNGTTVSTGTTTAAVTAPVVEAASTVSASGPIAVSWLLDATHNARSLSRNHLQCFFRSTILRVKLHDFHAR